MIKSRKLHGAALIVAMLFTPLIGCQKKEGPVEQAGKKVDQVTEKVGQDIEKAGSKIQDAAQGDKK